MSKLNEGFRPEIVRDMKTYEGLRGLWQRVFGDEPDFVDHLYESFGGMPTADRSAGSDIEGYVIKDADGKVVSALTCYRCGTYSGKDVYVSYAICTDPEHRGLGLAGMLTSHVRDIVTKELGGLSIVSPASPELIGFYEGLGYRPFFWSGAGTSHTEEESKEYIPSGDNWSMDDDWVSPGCVLTHINASMFNKYRESFLAEVPHISLSGKMTEFVKSIGPGGEAFYLINKGDAICAVEAGGQSSDEEGRAFAELLVNPHLKELSSEIEEELASELATTLGADELVYRMPGDAYCQSMIAGDLPEGDAEIGEMPYFGFPID